MPQPPPPASSRQRIPSLRQGLQPVTEIITRKGQRVPMTTSAWACELVSCP